MKKLIILLFTLLCASEAMAKCEYGGSDALATFKLSPKIPLDPSIPVGSVLYTKKFGTGSYKTFDCNKLLGDEYIVTSTGAEVPGVTGVGGKPVYETGIDGIGFQFSDMNLSKNGHVIPAVVGSSIVPVNETTGDYKFMTIWLIKTKPVINTANGSANQMVTFSAGNMATNPRAKDRLLLTGNLKIVDLAFKNTSCNISVMGSKQVTLQTIKMSELLAVSPGKDTLAKKDIQMKVDCPSEVYGNTLSYWFNPVGGGGSRGTGIMENMLTGDDAAKNVGVILKQNGRDIAFFDSSSYQLKKLGATQFIDFTADYYAFSKSAKDLSNGKVKAMVEVIIQEE